MNTSLPFKADKLIVSLNALSPHHQVFISLVSMTEKKGHERMEEHSLRRSISARITW